MGVRAAAREQVRSALVAAAYDLCAGSGFEAVTTQNVADQAGVSQRTFFRYFPAKEDVLLHVLDEHNRRICDVIRSRPDDEPDEVTLRQALQVYGDMNAAEIERTRKIVGLTLASSSLHKALMLRQAGWQERIHEALAQRGSTLVRDELRTRHLIAMTMAILSVAFRMTLGSSVRSIGDIIDSGFSLLGVLPDTASQEDL